MMELPYIESLAKKYKDKFIKEEPKNWKNSLKVINQLLFLRFLLVVFYISTGKRGRGSGWGRGGGEGRG